MDTASTPSGVHSLGASLARRPSSTGEQLGKLMSEAPPSGAAQVGQQTISALNDVPKSGVVDQNRKPEKQEVVDAVKNMNDFLQMVRRTLQFSMDEESGEMVVQVKDQETGKVIRQIPPEFMLKLAKQMDKLKGLLFEEKA